MQSENRLDPFKSVLDIMLEGVRQFYHLDDPWNGSEPGVSEDNNHWVNIPEFWFPNHIERIPLRIHLTTQLWSMQRHAILRRDNRRCCDKDHITGKRCQQYENLMVHHLGYRRLVNGKYIDIVGRELPYELITLCNRHHSLRHSKIA